MQSWLRGRDARWGPVLVWGPPEVHPEARICKKVAHRGGEGDTGGKWGSEQGRPPGKVCPQARVHGGNWSLVALGSYRGSEAHSLKFIPREGKGVGVFIHLVFLIDRGLYWWYQEWWGEGERA